MQGAPQTGGKLGRYELHGAIARGGMATVYVARMSGAAGFARTVAIKRLHPHLAADPAFSAMFVDEARLAARIRHPNVIDTLDVVADSGELFLVMDFVLGETLARLIRQTEKRGIVLPAPVVSSIVVGALEGLHAAHEATSERGEPLGIVHRDISPQNILVARDGVARVLDFGVAKAAGRIQETEGGEIKGKLAYMSPEQLTRKPIDRRCDIFAMGVVLWEALTSRRLFGGEDAASTLYAVMHEPITPPSTVVPGIPPAVDAVVLKALERDVDKRWATAQEMALALEAAVPPAPTRHAGKWVEELAAEALKIRADIVRTIDRANGGTSAPVWMPDESTGTHAMQGANSAPPGAESWRHLPGSGTHHPASGHSGVSSFSGIHASGVSQTSSPSHITPHGQLLPNQPLPPEEGPSMKLAVLGGLFAAIAIIGVVMGVVAIRARKAAAQAQAPDSPVVVVAAPPAAVSVAPQAEPAPEPEATPAPTPEPVAIADAGAPVAAALPPPSPGPRPVYTGPAAYVRPASTKPAPVDCTDPFTTDANGIKHPKPQCFKH
jgi:serine/threonine-protein kinase